MIREPETPLEKNLCSDCVHAKRIRSDRGAIFLQCLRSFSDPAYRKYPSLPVRTCRGYVTGGTQGGGAEVNQA